MHVAIATQLRHCATSNAMSEQNKQQPEMAAVMTQEEREAEQIRLAKVDLAERLFDTTIAQLQSKLDEAASELDREMGVRERCYPNWIEQGKVSRIDARDRFSRMKKAQEIIDFLLDISGKPSRMTTDEVPF